MPATGPPGQHTDEVVRSAAPKKPPRAPSWGLVLATTIRLWWQRRLRDLRHPWRALLAVVCVLAVAGAAVAVVMLTGTSTRTASSAAPATRSSAHAARSSGPARSQPAASGPSAATVTAQAQAAAWTATELSPVQAIACDPGMCTALAAHGVTRSRLRSFRPAAAAPAAGVIAASAADARLGQDAPVPLASFGTGTSEVQLRASYPGGGAAYQAALRSDLASRRAAGSQLLHSGRIQATAAGTAQLRAGQVDSRMLVVLALLASQRSWWVVAFGDASPGVPAAAAPFRQVVLVGPGGRGDAPGLARALALARGQHGAYQAAQVSTVRLAGGQAGLRIDFVAPSPLGLLAGASK
jgi:hypothetical protein